MRLSSKHIRNLDLEVSEELTWALFYGLAFTFCRWIGNYCILGRVFVTQNKSLLSRRERIFEEVWLAVLSFILLLASWIVFLSNDVGASILDTHPIVKGWPLNFVTFDTVYLLRVETGWYLHQMSRGWTASGIPIDPLMFYHHVGTLVIIVFCFFTNLLLLGVLTLCVFNISNPFLHVSKIAHVLGWREARKTLFAMFGVAFFLSRIVMLPFTVMKVGYVDAYKEDYVSFGTDLMLLGNVMMLILYGLQIHWMMKIINLLRKGGTGTTPKKSDNKNTVFSDTRPSNGAKKEN